MASRKFLSQIEILQETSLITPGATYIALGAKSDGLYQKVGSATELRLITTTDLTSYLPLTGGTLTGDLTVNTANPFNIIKTKNLVANTDIRSYNIGASYTHATLVYNNCFYGIANASSHGKVWRIEPVSHVLLTRNLTSYYGSNIACVMLSGFMYSVGDGGIIKIDPTTLIDTLIVSSSNFGSIPALTTDGTYLYVGSSSNGTIYKYSSTGALINSISAGSGINNLHWGGYDSGTNSVYFTTSSGGFMVKVSVTTFTVTST